MYTDKFCHAWQDICIAVYNLHRMWVHAYKRSYFMLFKDLLCLYELLGIRKFRFKPLKLNKNLGPSGIYNGSENQDDVNLLKGHWKA